MPPLYNAIFGFGGVGLGLTTGTVLVVFTGLEIVSFAIIFASSFGLMGLVTHHALQQIFVRIVFQEHWVQDHLLQVVEYLPYLLSHFLN